MFKLCHSAGAAIQKDNAALLWSFYQPWKGVMFIENIIYPVVKAPSERNVDQCKFDPK
jgi:hypothetical protein